MVGLQLDMHALQNMFLKLRCASLSMRLPRKRVGSVFRAALVGDPKLREGFENMHDAAFVVALSGIYQAGGGGGGHVLGT